jgi:hypothetical protein
MPMKEESPSVKILRVTTNSFFGIEEANEKGTAVDHCKRPIKLSAVYDHFSFGIEKFKAEDAAAKLQKRGLKLAGVSKDGLKFIDPTE